MAKLTKFIDMDKAPKISSIVLEFDNGSVIEIGRVQVDEYVLHEWLGPDETFLIAEIRAKFPAVDLLGVPDGRTRA